MTMMNWYEEMEKAEQERETQEYECAMAYKDGYNKAIDDYNKELKEYLRKFTVHYVSDNDFDYIAEQLKGGGKND